MTKSLHHSFIFAGILASLTFGLIGAASDPKDSNTNHSAAATGPDAKLIAKLASEDPRIVENALEDLETQSHPSINVLLTARKLLQDPRPTVRQKAARVLGTLHAEVDRNDLQAICFMLKSHDQREADNALKALRGLNAAETISEIMPLLKSSHKLLVRDACRTLAVLGNKNLIPSIEPLLKDPDQDVKTDAQAAIASLRAKP